MKFILNILPIIFITICLINNAQCATTHKHSHGSSNKERTEDGAYIARDSNHLDGDEHHSEFDHEAILGSVKEAEEFDNLNPEESKRRLAILVKKMDMNQDGFVSSNELHAWIIRSFKQLSEEEATERFADIDENDDYSITWEEYLNENYGLNTDDAHKQFIESEHSEEEIKMIEDDHELFNASDLNQDGVLNQDEFVLFNSPEEHPEMLPIILGQTLREKDTNGDKKIDFQEFIGESAKNHDKEWLVSEKEKFDHELDRDGDGILNGNEILAWIVPSNE